MSSRSDRNIGIRDLPTKPSLEYLRNAAKNRLSILRQSTPEAKLAEAQFALAREYGFASWRELKSSIESNALASADKSIPSPEDLARMRAEQSFPRKAIAIDPKLFDKFVGYYRLGACTIIKITRDGDHFYFEPTGKVRFELFPERTNKFFATAVPAQISFRSSPNGEVSELILHQDGAEQHARWIEQSIAIAIEEELKRRIATNMRSPGTEDALRHHIDDILRGQPDFRAMSPFLAALVVVQFPTAQQYFKRWGSLKSITFRAVGRNGADIYDVMFENGQTEWRISPLTPDGKIEQLGFRELP